VYAPSGAGGVGPYAFTFEILANTDIAVFKDNTLLTLTTHYTVTINANGTGSVTITAAGLALSPTSPTQYAIVGNRTIARATDFTTGGDFFANTINDELDQQTIFAQQNAEGLNRALQAPQTDPTTINMTLPAKATRASKTLAFDADGNPTPGVSAADVANAVTYATNAANSATAAASSASSASSSASAASGSASTASTQASNASTSATNASNSASSASTSATNAAASASTATTQASNASTSATNASNSASAASTSASNAATSETNAAASASTASTQATNASNSATAASGSATSAASSAAAAASALDSFDDRYLGTKTSDPTLDNDGNALVAGALYFSTTQNVMKVYDGASWITATSAGATSLLRFRYVATSGQTTFSGADAAAATLTYTVNNIAVHRNGVTLDTSEYTASNGTSIVLTVAAGTGDIIDIIAFKSFTVADALSAVSGGTVNGAVTVTGALTANGNVILGDASTDTLNVGNGGLVKDASGNVGIGTSSPAKQLDLAASNQGITTGDPLNTLRFTDTDTSSATGQPMGRIEWYSADTDTAGVKAYIQAQATDGSPDGDMIFATNHVSGGGTAERMRIQYDGNVGIGTSSPAYKLDVSGDRARIVNTGVAELITSSSGGGGNWEFGVDASGNGFIYSGQSKYLAISTNGSERARITSGGDLLVGVTSWSDGGGGTQISSTVGSAAVNAKFSSNSTSSTARIYFTNPNGAVGSISTSGSATTYATSSDHRLKNTIAPMIGALAKVALLKPCTYKWNVDGSNGEGFIAHELQAVVPQCVTGEKDAVDTDGNPQYQGIDTSFLVATLTAAIQEQQALITTLTDRITALENA
jgi:hypothetical protein